MCILLIYFIESKILSQDKTIMSKIYITGNRTYSSVQTWFGMVKKILEQRPYVLCGKLIEKLHSVTKSNN